VSDCIFDNEITEEIVRVRKIKDMIEVRTALIIPDFVHFRRLGSESFLKSKIVITRLAIHNNKIPMENTFVERSEILFNSCENSFGEPEILFSENKKYEYTAAK
jgi:hypothetical protein